MVGLLSFAFYNAFIKQGSCHTDGECSTKRLSPVLSFTILLIITIIAFTAPHLAQYFSPCCVAPTAS